MAVTVSRECGSCTLCCRLTAVFELAKPVNEPCASCEAGKGCGVYDARPRSCRAFECLWYANTRMPDSLRPDRCGVMLEKVRGRRVYLALVEPERLTAWQEPGPFAAIGDILRSGLAVVVSAGPGKVKHMLLPEGGSADAVWGELAAAYGEGGR